MATPAASSSASSSSSSSSSKGTKRVRAEKSKSKSKDSASEEQYCLIFWHPDPDYYQYAILSDAEVSKYNIKKLAADREETDGEDAEKAMDEINELFFNDGAMFNSRVYSFTIHGNPKGSFRVISIDTYVNI